MMDDLVDLEQFPLHQPRSRPWRELVARCQASLGQDGMANLDKFMLPAAVEADLEQIRPIVQRSSFTQSRSHNIYFDDAPDGLASHHPALQTLHTINRTICADQMEATGLARLYQWPEFRLFLAAVMSKDQIYLMKDPLARFNVMSYRNGETLNWHFDRSEFTTTLLLQAPQNGGRFEFAKDLRSDDDPAYDAVSDLLSGARQPKSVSLEAGTLNVFRGRNTAHRVTTVRSETERVVAVFSFFDRPGVSFSDEERLGFYGRTS